jgi:hypothetical protein
MVDTSWPHAAEFRGSTIYPGIFLAVTVLSLMTLGDLQTREC